MPIDTTQAEQILRDNFAPWVLALSPTVRHTDATSATLVMPSDPKLHRTGGIVSGQALMALADTAMVIAICAALGEFRPVATVDVNTTFMRPATDTGIVATALVLRLGRTMAFCQARLTTDNAYGQLVANVTGTYALPPKN